MTENQSQPTPTPAPLAAIAATAARVWSALQNAIFAFFLTSARHGVVIARAGCGKTTTIIEAVKRFAAINPALKILCVAFNKKNADELSDRLGQKRGREWKPMNQEAKTLNGLGWAFCTSAFGWKGRKDAVNDSRNAAIARTVCGDDCPDEVVGYVKRLASWLKCVAPVTMNRAVALVEMYRCDAVPDDREREAGWSEERVADLALAACKLAANRDRINADGHISYDDQIFLPLVMGLTRAWYGMVIVDEAQDMNPAQLMLAQRACKRDGRIILVGDDRQAIYAWRGADVDALSRMGSALDAVTLTLNVTYRCGSDIVAYCQQWVPDFTAGDPALIPAEVRARRRAAGIDEVKGRVRTMGTVGATSARQALITEAGAGDLVLSRTNAPLATLALAMLKAGKRAAINGRSDVGAALVALVERLSRGRGAHSMPELLGKLKTWEERETERAKARGGDAGQARVEYVADVAETFRALAEDCIGPAALVERVRSLFVELEAGQAPQGAILLSSIHKAKGSEAPRVYVLADTILRRQGQEELNLAYVACSRAQDDLVMVTGAK